MSAVYLQQFPSYSNHIAKNRHFYVGLPRPSFFCLPWGRLCGNHAKRCMNEKTIQSLPNLSQHVPIYLQQFPSYSNHAQVQKTAVFTYRSPHFCFPWRRPCDYHAIYVAWMERQFIIIIIIINLLAQKHDKVTRATKQIERDSKDTDATNSCRRKVQIKLVRNTLQK